MNISRGFRRLSVLAGVLGFLFTCLLDLGDKWDAQQYLGVAFFTFVPAALVLLLGWAIAGFNSN
jgi:hypothetical protein